MTRLSPLALLVLASTGFSQAPMDDCLWIAGRFGQDLTKVDRSGEVLQTVDLSTNGFNLRSVNRAPDGKLWVINYIVGTMTIVDRNGGNLLNITASGTPYAVAFDRSGDAYVTLSGSSAVDKYDANGNYLTTYSVAASPLGITIDNQGMVWVAHRTGPPGLVSKINPTAVPPNVVTYSLPSASPMLPVEILTDYRPPGTGSHVWVIGDRSNELIEMDSSGNVVNNIPVGTRTSGLSGLAVDRNNNIWVTNYVNGEVENYDSTSGALILNFITAGSIDITMDSMGYPWIVDRNPTPAELSRYDLLTGNLEVIAPVGAGAYNSPDAAGFHHALVIDPNGDDDGDGELNYIEIGNGTSPYDAQSNSLCSFNTAGPTRLGGSVDMLVSGSAPGSLAVLLATALGTPVNLGPLGTLYLDPPSILLLAPLEFAIPSTTSIPIPNNPALVSTIWMQGFYFTGSALALSNKAGVKIFP